MKKFGSVLLIVIVLICAIYFIAVDLVIKRVLEREATNAIGARVDIADVSFHLLPTSLSLRGVQITNRERPMSNLLTADVVALPLQLGELLEHKLLIDRMQIHGLRFAQPRTDNGAIEGQASAPEAAAPTATVAQELQQQMRTQQGGDTQTAQAELMRLHEQWQQRLRTLPSAAEIADFRFRAQSPVAGNRARLQAEINDELANLRGLNEQFAVDYERVKPLLGGNADSAVQIPSAAPPSITGGLLGRQFKPVFEQLMGLVPRERGNADLQEPQQQWQVIARHIDVDGEIELGASRLGFVGSIDDLTPQPRQFNVITRFALRAAEGQPAQLDADGSIDARKIPLQNLRFDLRNFQVEQLPLSTDPLLQITVARAIADIQGLLALTGNQIDINVLARFQQAQLQTSGSDNPVARAAVATLRDVHDFDLNLQASGDVNDPMLTLNSSLDGMLASAIQRELAAQPKGPQDAALHSVGAELLQLRQQLLQTQAALQELLAH